MIFLFNKTGDFQLQDPLVFPGCVIHTIYYHHCLPTICLGQGFAEGVGPLFGVQGLKGGWRNTLGRVEPLWANIVPQKPLSLDDLLSLSIESSIECLIYSDFAGGFIRK